MMRVGVLGWGKVAAELRCIYEKERQDYVMERVFARNPSKICEESTRRRVTDRPEAIVSAEDIDVVVDLVNDPTYSLPWVLLALRSGKHVVTANRSMVAHHLAQLEHAAAESGAEFLFEGAVGNGIPILGALETLDSKCVQRISAVVNGTTNLILDVMAAAGCDLATAISVVGTLGTAEPDISDDVEGVDAAEKLLILLQVGHRVTYRYQEIDRIGLSGIGETDITAAKRDGWIPRYLAVAERFGPNDVRAVVAPFLVRQAHPLAQARGRVNAFCLEFADDNYVMLWGRSNSPSATAAAVHSDVARIARRRTTHRQPTARPSGSVRTLREGDSTTAPAVPSSSHLRLLRGDGGTSPCLSSALRTSTLRDTCGSAGQERSNPIGGTAGLPGSADFTVEARS